MAARKVDSPPAELEPFSIDESEDDNIHFTFDSDEDVVELSLDVRVSDTPEIDDDAEDEGLEEDVISLYSVFLDIDDMKELIKWLKQALKYAEYVDKHGPTIPKPTIAGVLGKDGTLERLY